MSSICFKCGGIARERDSSGWLYCVSPTCEKYGMPVIDRKKLADLGCCDNAEYK